MTRMFSTILTISIFVSSGSVDAQNLVFQRTSAQATASTFAEAQVPGNLDTDSDNPTPATGSAPTITSAIGALARGFPLTVSASADCFSQFNPDGQVVTQLISMAYAEQLVEANECGGRAESEAETEGTSQLEIVDTTGAGGTVTVSATIKLIWSNTLNTTEGQGAATNIVTSGQVFGSVSHNGQTFSATASLEYGFGIVNYPNGSYDYFTVDEEGQFEETASFNNISAGSDFELNGDASAVGELNYGGETSSCGSGYEIQQGGTQACENWSEVTLTIQ